MAALVDAIVAAPARTAAPLTIGAGTTTPGSGTATGTLTTTAVTVVDAETVGAGIVVLVPTTEGGTTIPVTTLGDPTATGTATVAGSTVDDVSALIVSIDVTVEVHIEAQDAYPAEQAAWALVKNALSPIKNMKVTAAHAKARVRDEVTA